MAIVTETSWKLGRCTISRIRITNEGTTTSTDLSYPTVSYAVWCDECESAVADLLGRIDAQGEALAHSAICTGVGAL